MGDPVSSQRFAVVDVETSGLSIRRDNVLRVGVVVVDGLGNVLDRWSSLLAPRRKWWFRVGPSSLHGIRRRDVRFAPPAAAVLTELANRIAGARFVAHNAEFDLAFLGKAARRTGVQLRFTDPLCTL
ncbi:MAG: 3'-5' exonuclease, partial [Actinobacteria bacterium]|nr:3'-5' exonuclease [Actinomycetota bacterium]